MEVVSGSGGSAGASTSVLPGTLGGSGEGSVSGRPTGLEEKLRAALLAGRSKGVSHLSSVPPLAVSDAADGAPVGGRHVAKRSRSPQREVEGSLVEASGGTTGTNRSSLTLSLQSLWRRTQAQGSSPLDRQKQQQRDAQGVGQHGEESGKQMLPSLVDQDRGRKMHPPVGNGAGADSSFSKLMEELEQLQSAQEQQQQQQEHQGRGSKHRRHTVTPFSSEVLPAKVREFVSAVGFSRELSMEEAMMLMGVTAPPSSLHIKPQKEHGRDAASAPPSPFTQDALPRSGNQEQGQHEMLDSMFTQGQGAAVATLTGEEGTAAAAEEEDSEEQGDVLGMQFQSFLGSAGDAAGGNMEEFLKGLDGLSSAFGELGDLLQPPMGVPSVSEGVFKFGGEADVDGGSEVGADSGVASHGSAMGSVGEEKEATAADEGDAVESSGGEFMDLLNELMMEQPGGVEAHGIPMQGRDAAHGPSRTRRLTSVTVPDEWGANSRVSRNMPVVPNDMSRGRGGERDMARQQELLAEGALTKLNSECQKRKAEFAQAQAQAAARVGGAADGTAGNSGVLDSTEDDKEDSGPSGSRSSENVMHGSSSVLSSSPSSSSSTSATASHQNHADMASYPHTSPHVHGPAQQIESALLDNSAATAPSTGSCSRGRAGEEEEGGEEEGFQNGTEDMGKDPIQLLVTVAKAIVSGNQPQVHRLLTRLNQVASVYGDVSQRLSAYFLEGLLARISGTAPKHNPDPSGVEPFLPTRCAPNESIAAVSPPQPGAQGGHAQPTAAEHLGAGEALHSTSALEDVVGVPASPVPAQPQNPPPCNSQLLESFQVLVNASPYLTFGQVAANSTILEVLAGESRVHIIDFGIGHALQWPALLQALGARPGGPPHVRLTGIETPQGGPRRPYCVYKAGARLTMTAKMWGVPFEYLSLQSRLEDVKPEMLKLEKGEAVAVNCALRLSQLLDEAPVPGADPRTAVLRCIRALEPKVCVVVEQVSNLNSPFFLSRFYEALYYYALLFESFDASLPRNTSARRVFEEQVLGRAIVNLVACEGQERVERQEPLWCWEQRMQRAGFRPHTVSETVLDTARALLATYNKVGHEVVQEADGSLLLTWKGRPLLAMTSWETA